MESITVKGIFPASSKQIFSDWLDSDTHRAFTGGEAQIENKIGSEFTAWDDYIFGSILELEENSKILMKWTTTEFPPEAEPSIVEIVLIDCDEGCELTINHSNIPDGQGKNYEDGWKDHYLEPMLTYYQESE